MAAVSAFTDEQKTGFVALAREKGRAAAAKKAGVSTATISTWAKAAGVNFTTAAAAAPKKKRRKKNRRSNGKANGHRPTAGMPVTSAGLDAIEAQLADALDGVMKMRAAFRQVFG